LHGAGDLLHPLGAGRQAQQPDGLDDAVRDGDARTDERDQYRMVSEEIQWGLPVKN
jgi:hypothetical protein